MLLRWLPRFCYHISDMKFLTSLVCILVLGLAVALSQYSFAQAPATPATTTTQKPPAPGTLTDAEIASLKTQYKDEKTGNLYSFSASFGALSVTDPIAKRKYANSGKVPFRITCALYETKEVNKKKLTQRLSGTARFYLLDSDGKVIEQKSAPLDNMCPS